MYCVFCGKPDVKACSRCGRWICPRHQHRWGAGVLCIGCRRRLARVRAMQAAVALIAVGMIGLTLAWAFSQ
ncbi:MAG TPA: hypothetical protein VH120_19055 [Gemmataceae bacterium]|jgi:hypothetical protein|nr:hypothetical protein [Gemmataceae bacterium]